MKLFEPLSRPGFHLANRIVMAPMTRSRSDAAAVVPPYAAEYYGSRADAGLLITEGTSPSAMGLGYVRTPGAYTEAQVDAWKAVTAAVHERGGRIFLQLMHVGRIAHSANRPIPDPPVAPSAIRAKGQMWTDAQGMQPNDEPRELALSEIPGVIAEFASASRNAMSAGFDGVELHAASGYLPNQFLATGSNRRNDAYGGPVENRIRFVVEVLEAMISAVGDASRVGIKVSPGMKFNDIEDDDPVATHVALVRAIDRLGLAHLHVMRTGIGAENALRDVYRGTLLVGGGFSRDEAEATLTAGRADAIVFGTAYLANPDLVARFRKGAALNEPDKATFYTPGPKGYTDYPVLS